MRTKWPRSFCLAAYGNDNRLRHRLAHVHAHRASEARAGHLLVIDLDLDSCHRVGSLSPAASDGRVVGINTLDLYFTIPLVADENQARGDGLSRRRCQRHFLGRGGQVLTGPFDKRDGNAKVGIALIVGVDLQYFVAAPVGELVGYFQPDAVGN